MTSLRFIWTCLIIVGSSMSCETLDYWKNPDEVEITYDGPAMFGTPITFTAVYKPSSGSVGNHTYKFVFEDDIRGEAREIITRDTNMSQSYTFNEDIVTYSHPRMEVKVHRVIDESRFLLIARSKIDIQFTGDIVRGESIDYREAINITSDGPVMIGTPITVTAVYKSFSGSVGNHTYKFVFMDDVRCEVREIITWDPNVSQTFTFYENDTTPFTPTMEVRIYQIINKSRYMLVGKDEIGMGLLEDIPGTIKIHQDNETTITLDKNTIQGYALNEPVKFIAKVHDPSGYFNNWNMSYRWMVDYQELEHITQDIANYSFERPNIHLIQAVLTATNVSHTRQMGANASIMDGPTRKYGYFNQYIYIREPIGELKVEGQTNLDNGKLGLKITCQHGSIPFEWCWQILDIGNVSEAQNFNCDQFNYTQSCSYSIKHHFSEKGTYYLGFQVKNPVSVKRKLLVIQTHGSTQSWWTVLISGVALIVLIIIMIGLGIIYRFGRRQRRNLPDVDPKSMSSFKVQS